MRKFFLSMFAFIVAYTCSGQSGTLDNSFGGDGAVITPFARTCYKALTQTDGKIVAVGVKYTTSVYPQYPSTAYPYGNSLFSIARYNIDGSLDQTFGIGGKVQYYNGISSLYNPFTGALQNDGKILVSAVMLNADSNYDFVLMRLNTDGTLDNTFGNNGKVQTDYHSENNYAVGIAIQQDGKIIQYGNLRNSNQIPIMVRYLPNGTIDSLFGTNGFIDSIHLFFYPVGIHILSSGQILMAGAASLLRYTSNGILDTTFISSSLSVGGSYSEIDNMFVSNNGSIFLTGYVTIGYRSYPTLIKTTAAGVRDSTFNRVGINIDSFALATGLGLDVAVQNDGKILVLDYAAYYQTGGAEALVVIRFTAGGQIDSSFGVNGNFILDTALVRQQDCESITLQADGKILIAGSGTTNSASGFMILRLLNDLNLGIISFSTTDNSVQIYPNPIHEQVTLKYDLSTDEIISVDLYDLQGKLVQGISKNEYKAQGSHAENINIKTTTPSGNYILRVGNSEGNGMSIKVTVR